jgi:hypothetical protein
MWIWIACNLLGVVASAAIVLGLRMPTSPYGGVATFLVLVFPTTIAQWLLLRKLLGLSPLWLLTIPLGCILFLSLVWAIPPGLWQLIDDEGIGTLSALYAILGFLVGGAQWLLLRRRLGAAWVWVAANAAGLGLGFALVLSTGLIDLSESASYLVVFAIYALLTGGALGWMLSRGASTRGAIVGAA